MSGAKKDFVIKEVTRSFGAMTDAPTQVVASVFKSSGYSWLVRTSADLT